MRGSRAALTLSLIITLGFPRFSIPTSAVRAKSTESGSGGEEDFKMEFSRVAAVSARVKFLRHLILTLTALTKGEYCRNITSLL